jgi:hypothetical protein
MKNLSLILLLFFVTSGLWAQESYLSKDEAIENMLLYFSESDEQSIDYEEFSSVLSLLYDNPINLNECDDENLADLNLFSSIQIMNLIDYRKKNNGFASIYELRLVPGLSSDQIFLAIPFLKTSSQEKYSPKINLKNLSRMSRHSVMLRYQRVIEEQAAYIPDENGETKYLGSPDRIYSRYKFQFSNKLRAGITADKDAGEPFFKDPNKQGFDFYSGFIQLQNQGVIKSLVVGDYALQFGQGLALWNGFGMGKSNMVSNVSKFGKGVDKYSSTDENNFFRGVATTLQYKNAEFSAFFSSKRIDGRVDTDTLENDIDLFTSFDNTGLHAKQSDFDKKKTIGVTLYGSNFTYILNRLKMGLTYVTYQFTHAFEPSSQLYKKHDFSGDRNSNASFSYQWNLNHIFLSGEAALDENLNMAITNNAVFNISTKVGVAVLHRYFEKGYNALYSTAFSEGSRVQNEQGFYTGLNFYPTKNWILKAYVDFYEFPWMRYQISSPSEGLDYIIMAEYALSSNFNFYIKYKNETRAKDLLLEESKIKTQEDLNRQQLRLHFNYGDRAQLHFRSRLEWSKYKFDEQETGLIAYQDIIYDWKKMPLKSTLRFLMFDTDSYDSRIYAYENELLYNYAIPAFSGQGIRTYVLLMYKVLKNLDFWLKYGYTIYNDRNIVGSGDTEIVGNKKSEIKLQLRWKF